MPSVTRNPRFRAQRHEGTERPVVGRAYLYHGKRVLVTGGCYTDPIYGRLSNFWHFSEIIQDGSLGPDESAYDHQDFFPVKESVTVQLPARR